MGKKTAKSASSTSKKSPKKEGGSTPVVDQPTGAMSAPATFNTSAPGGVPPVPSNAVPPIKPAEGIAIAPSLLLPSSFTVSQVTDILVTYFTRLAFDPKLTFQEHLGSCMDKKGNFKMPQPVHWSISEAISSGRLQPGDDVGISLVYIDNLAADPNADIEYLIQQMADMRASAKEEATAQTAPVDASNPKRPVDAVPGDITLDINVSGKDYETIVKHLAMETAVKGVGFDTTVWSYARGLTPDQHPQTRQPLDLFACVRNNTEHGPILQVQLEKTASGELVAAAPFQKNLDDVIILSEGQRYRIRIVS